MLYLKGRIFEYNIFCFCTFIGFKEGGKTMSEKYIKSNISNEIVHTTSKSIIIEVIMFFTYAFFAVNWIAGSTLTPQIMEYFQLEDFTSATFISNAITVAKIIGNFMAAYILNKLLLRKSIALGSLLIVLGNVIAIFAPTYPIFVIGRFVMGFGGALHIVYFSPIVVKFFSPHDRAAVNAINSAAYTAGGFIALIIAGPVINWLSTWQKSLGFFAIINFVLFVLWLIFGKDIDSITDSKNDSKDNKYSIIDAMKEKIFWFLPLTYSGVLTFYLVLLNIFPISGYAVIDSKKLSALITVGGLLGTAIAMVLSKKYSRRIPVIRISGIFVTLSGFIMLRANSGIVAAISAISVGIFMFVPMTSLMMIPQELKSMTPNKLTAVMGLFWLVSYVVETIMFFVIGKVIDANGYSAGLNLALILSLTFFIGSFLLPETNKN